MKKVLALIFILCLLSGCGQSEEKQKMTIVTTLFPQYDFCRQIVGDKAEVILLLPPGMESHNFEPGIKDIKNVNQCDIFIFTGALMEPWAQNIIETTGTEIVDVSEHINLCSHEHNGEDHHEHHEKDPHIWTSPKNAKIMVQNILDALCAQDEKNADFYKNNAEKIFGELEKLDEEFSSLAKEAENLTLCHGGNFSLTYLQRDYGFNFISAYDSCASQQEPSAMRVKEIIDLINSQKLQGVFCQELNQGRVADTVSKETGVPVYLLHSCHNLSKEEFLKGETYVSLMKNNAQNIKKVIENVNG